MSVFNTFNVSPLGRLLVVLLRLLLLSESEGRPP